MNSSFTDENVDTVYQSIRGLLEYYNKDVIEAYHKARADAEEDLKNKKLKADNRLKEVASQINSYKNICGITTIPQADLKRYINSQGPFNFTLEETVNELDRIINLTKSYYTSFGSWEAKSPFIIRLITFVPLIIVLSALEAGFMGFLIAVVISCIAPNIYNNRNRDAAKENFYNTAARTTSLMDYWLELEKEEATKIFSEANSTFKNKLVAINKLLFFMLAEFNSRYAQIYRRFDSIELPWNNKIWQNWAPQSISPEALRVGNLSIIQNEFSKLNSEIKLNYALPALTSFKNGRAVLLKGSGFTRDKAIEAVQSMILRLLGTVPPGKLKVLFIDPVGLGQNVSDFMPLGDYEESLINNRAWSEPQHIEKRLANITEHMETLIQKYLRSEFKTIEDYNLSAGEIAEPYLAVVVIDFPVNFNDVTARRLQSIAQNGPRCGVYSFIVNDTEKELPYGFNIGELERVCEVIAWEKDRFVWNDPLLVNCLLELDQPPAKEIFENIIKTVGEQSSELMKVEVPYPKLLKMAGLSEDAWWSGSADDLIKIPLGPSGARKVQHLVFGDGTAHHALVVGRPGSGKSNLMHIIITTASLLYSPSELHFYLVDFKEGVEFKPYAELPPPHIRVVAVESEREFGLSVLEGLGKELERRGEAFRLSGASGIADYRRVSGVKMPRIILMVDEFQVFFIRDDTISSESGLILDRLVRQGRAFGIHVLLGSQTLAGAYSLPRATLDLMAVRIALQSSDADSRLILAEDNPAARLLTRPGEAIYNAASGLVEGNSLFQVALYSDEDRLHYLKKVFRLGQGKPDEDYSIIVFEGNKPAKLNESKPIIDLLHQDELPKGLKAVNVFLGEPVAIQPPTAARFRKQSGSHLLVVTREEAEGIGLMISSIISLALQQNPNECIFQIIDFSSADAHWTELLGIIKESLPHRLELMGRRDLPKLFSDLGNILRQRQEKEIGSTQNVFLFVIGLHRVRDLRQEERGFGIGSYNDNEGPSLNEQFTLLLREGPEVGIHIVCWCDTCGSLMKVIDRMLGEFTMRVAGRMNHNDSLTLLDDSIASRLDKPHRMVYFDEDKPGYLEKFRPYSAPTGEWLREIGIRLKRKGV